MLSLPRFPRLSLWLSRCIHGLSWGLLVLGLLLGPLFYLWDEGSSLLLTGLVGGTLAFVISEHVAKRASSAKRSEP